MAETLVFQPLLPPARVRSRLAPTPSGYLHAGNAFSFALTWLAARAQNGRLLLRIDDLDAARTRPEYVRDIFETLDWMGLDYDEGPRSAEEFEDVWSQRRRLPLYEEALRRLQAAKNAVFACECSRAALAAASTGGRYSGVCRSKKTPFDTPSTALRFAVEDSAVVEVPDARRGVLAVELGREMGSFVARRKDGVPAYHLASVADDAAFGVTLVVRGEDLLPSTAAQLLLARRLGVTGFERASFWHHPLVRGAGGEKLSKSAGAASLKALRFAGESPRFIYRSVARYLGLKPESPRTLDELAEAFRATNGLR